MTWTVYTLPEKPDYREEINRLSDDSWPAFLHHGNITRWNLLFEIFPAFQLLVLDSVGELLAVGHTVPILWDGTMPDLPETMEGILIRAEQSFKKQGKPNTLCALSAMVSPNHQGKGLSSRLIQEMRELTRELGYSSLIAPIRPVWKSRYPLIPMENFVEWKRQDGAPLDPWIRVHWKLGAQPLCVAPNTLTVEGTSADWESWTGMVFPESGSYVIPGALQPMVMDTAQDLGGYEDPNYWMIHPVD